MTRPFEACILRFFLTRCAVGAMISINFLTDSIDLTG